MLNDTFRKPYQMLLFSLNLGHAQTDGQTYRQKAMHMSPPSNVPRAQVG